MVNKYLEFKEGKPKKKTRVIDVYNKCGEDLGEISWSPAWRKYCFGSFYGNYYDSNCLKEIIDKLDQLNKEHKERK